MTMDRASFILTLIGHYKRPLSDLTSGGVESVFFQREFIRLVIRPLISDKIGNCLCACVCFSVFVLVCLLALRVRLCFIVWV